MKTLHAQAIYKRDCHWKPNETSMEISINYYSRGFQMQHECCSGNLSFKPHKTKVLGSYSRARGLMLYTLYQWLICLVWDPTH